MKDELIISTKKVAARLADVITDTNTNMQLLAELTAAYEAVVRRVLILEKLTTKDAEEQIQ